MYWKPLKLKKALQNETGQTKTVVIYLQLCVKQYEEKKTVEVVPICDGEDDKIYNTHKQVLLVRDDCKYLAYGYVQHYYAIPGGTFIRRCIQY